MIKADIVIYGNLLCDKEVKANLGGVVIYIYTIM